MSGFDPNSFSPSYSPFGPVTVGAILNPGALASAQACPGCGTAYLTIGSGAIYAEPNGHNFAACEARKEKWVLTTRIANLEAALRELANMGSHVENCNAEAIMGTPSCPACVETGRQISALATKALDP